MGGTLSKAFANLKDIAGKTWNLSGELVIPTGSPKLEDLRSRDINHDAKVRCEFTIHGTSTGKTTGAAIVLAVFDVPNFPNATNTDGLTTITFDAIQKTPIILGALDKNLTTLEKFSFEKSKDGKNVWHVV